MDAVSDRLKLPFLAVAQAQKEMTHNEALALLDVAVQPVVQAVAPAAIPAAPTVGQCWIVSEGATGAWAGHDGAIAGWTAGGWRFAESFDGMEAWSIADGTHVRRSAGSWVVGAVAATAILIGGTRILGPQQPAIAAPIGGTTSDGEARATIAAILTALRTHGIIASG